MYRNIRGLLFLCFFVLHLKLPGGLVIIKGRAVLAANKEEAPEPAGCLAARPEGAE